jgi:hypothetical protein
VSRSNSIRYREEYSVVSSSTAPCEKCPSTYSQPDGLDAVISAASANFRALMHADVDDRPLIRDAFPFQALVLFPFGVAPVNLSGRERVDIRR